MKKSILAVSLASIALTVAAQAAVVITTNNQIGNGTTPFTPTYTPLSNDLINGLSPTTVVPSAASFALEASDGTPALTNGVFPPLATGVVGSHVGLATGGNTGGTQLVYVFPTSNIARVDMYGGWNDNGRDEQLFTIEFSANGGSTWGTLISSGDFNPTVGAGLQSATRVSISDSAGALATGVNAMRVSFLAVENGYTGYAELDVVAVPEPSALGLLGIAAAGVAARRRRR
jgi:hypothetical protein